MHDKFYYSMAQIRNIPGNTAGNPIYDIFCTMLTYKRTSFRKKIIFRKSWTAQADLRVGRLRPSHRDRFRHRCFL